MKKMKILQYIVCSIGGLFLFISCTKYDINPAPDAKFTIAKTTYNVLEQVNVVNEGSGEYFSFWPGDAGHKYALRANGIDKGLIPNQGKNFNYSYLFTGTYTLVMVASSYDENTQVRTEKVDSVKITVTSGTSGNIIYSIEMYNCMKGYNALGRFIGGDSILFPIDYVNRTKSLTDSGYIAIINQRSFIFSASAFAKVYGENNTLLTGLSDDTYTSNLIVPVSYNPLVYHSRISHLKVVAQDNTEKTYTIAAMLYPEMFSFSAKGVDAFKFSKDGGAVHGNDSISAVNFIASYSDSCYFGIKIKTFDNEYDAVPTFTTTPGCKVTLDGVEGEQISGVTTVHIVNNKPLLYRITKTESGFKLTTKVAVYVYN
jgi:hypothetical protein